MRHVICRRKFLCNDVFGSVAEFLLPRPKNHIGIEFFDYACLVFLAQKHRLRVFYNSKICSTTFSFSRLSLARSLILQPYPHEYLYLYLYYALPKFENKYEI